MKKIIFLASLSLILLSSCSSDGSSSEPSTLVFVKKNIRTHSANNIEMLTYTYDGNKMVSESSGGGFVVTYTYTGNVITKIEERVNNNLQSSREYTH